MSYQGYVDYIMSGNVAEYCFILSRQGAFCGSNLPVQAMPTYEFQMEDEKDPNKTHKIVVN